MRYRSNKNHTPIERALGRLSMLNSLKYHTPDAKFVGNTYTGTYSGHVLTAWLEDGMLLVEIDGSMAWASDEYCEDSAAFYRAISAHASEEVAHA